MFNFFPNIYRRISWRRKLNDLFLSCFYACFRQILYRTFVPSILCVTWRKGYFRRILLEKSNVIFKGLKFKISKFVKFFTWFWHNLHTLMSQSIRFHPRSPTLSPIKDTNNLKEPAENEWFYKGVVYVFAITERILARWLVESLVYKSIHHGNDVICHAVPDVYFLVFRKKTNIIVKNKSTTIFNGLHSYRP